jgi:hypothetical protein
MALRKSKGLVNAGTRVHWNRSRLAVDDRYPAERSAGSRRRQDTLRQAALPGARFPGEPVRNPKGPRQRRYWWRGTVAHIVSNSPAQVELTRGSIRGV